MKKTIIAAGASSALLFGAVAIAQTTGSTSSTDQPGTTTCATAGATTDTTTDTRTTTPENMPAEGSRTSGATNASEYGDEASGTAMDAAGERG